MSGYPKRLIEVDLPIKKISAHARREKSIRHGHISTLHNPESADSIHEHDVEPEILLQPFSCFEFIRGERDFTNARSSQNFNGNHFNRSLWILRVRSTEIKSNPRFSDYSLSTRHRDFSCAITAWIAILSISSSLTIAKLGAVCSGCGITQARPDVGYPRWCRTVRVPLGFRRFFKRLFSSSILNLLDIGCKQRI